MTWLNVASIALFAASANVLARTDAAFTLAHPLVKPTIDLLSLVLGFGAVVATFVASGWLAAALTFFGGGMVGGLASGALRRRGFLFWFLLEAGASLWFLAQCASTFAWFDTH